MSKLLQKILSAAFFPAALLIVSKVIGMAIANRIFELGWEIRSNAGGLFSVQVVYPDMEAAYICNSVSNLIMILTMSFGTGITLFQGYFLHTSHQNPKVLIKMIQFDFIVWLADSKTIFPNMAVWLAFLWISTLVSISQSLQSINHPWVSILGLVIAIVMTWLSAKDFEREINTFLPENGTLKIE
jgi:hypothetical protein